jgi:hypothetical protein
MGLRKDLDRKVKENLVTIKVIQGSNQDDAVLECVKIVWDETLECARLGKLLLKTFPQYSASITDYIKHSFNMMNNYTHFHLTMRDRYTYLESTYVKLPEFEKEKEELKYFFQTLLPNKDLSDNFEILEHTGLTR